MRRWSSCEFFLDLWIFREHLGHQGRLLGHLGLIWGSFGCLFLSLGTYLDPLDAFFGVSGAPLKSREGPMGNLWKSQGALGPSLGCRVAFWVVLWAGSGKISEFLGGMLVPFWVQKTMDIAFWRCLGRILGRLRGAKGVL